MLLLRSTSVRRRTLGIAAGVAFLFALGAPVHANDGPPPPPSVQQAQAAVNQARAQAHATDTTLSVQQEALAAAQAHLAAIQAQVVETQQLIAADEARVTELQSQIDTDRRTLGDFLRSYYKAGPNPGLSYVLEGGSIGEIAQRAAQASHVQQQVNALARQVMAKESDAKTALADAQKAAADLDVLQQQATTAATVLAIQEENAAQAALAAHQSLSQSISGLQAAQTKAATDAAAAAAAAAASAAPPPPGVTFHPVAGSTFTVDTDLTQPSGMSADQINTFLKGTALAGLGDSYINAEKTHHVSARYLVAHSILESNWGSSAIAQDKHNIFGFGANDANPYADAKTFVSFDDCIQFVANFVAVHYLSPDGAYFHGPTLRGMNVRYASDPLWASKIARIANTIP